MGQISIKPGMILKFKQPKCDTEIYCYTLRGQDHFTKEYEGTAYTIIKVIMTRENTIAVFRDKGVTCYSYVEKSIELKEIEYY